MQAESVCPARSGACHQCLTRLPATRGPSSGTASAAPRSEPCWPNEGNLVRICDIRRPLTWHPLVSAGAQPVSQPPTPVGRAPAGDSTIMRSRCPNSEQPLLGREPYQRPCVGRGETGVLPMPTAEYFRRQADICIRLSLIASSEEVMTRLIGMAQDFHARVDVLEAQERRPPKRSQKIGTNLSDARV